VEAKAPNSSFKLETIIETINSMLERQNMSKSIIHTLPPPKVLPTHTYKVNYLSIVNFHIYYLTLSINNILSFSFF